MSIINRLNVIKAVLASSSDPMAAAATNTVAGLMTQRIFDEGKATNGSPIGRYSEKPTYISPKSVQRGGVKRSALKPIGKTGQTVFKNGKPHKSQYFVRGYAQFRTAVGRQADKVDLNLSGASMLSLKVKKRSAGVWAFGYTDAMRMQILKGNEARYKKTIFTPSDTERKAGIEAAKQIFKDRIK